MIVRFLFWNLGRRDLRTQIASIVREHSVDVVALAECDIHGGDIAGALTEQSRRPFRHSISYSGRIKVITTFASEQFEAHFDDQSGRLSIHKLTLENQPSILIGVVHLLDQRNNDVDDRFSFATRVSDGIRSVERELNIDRTMVIGDFNMDPFEPGMTSAAGFHAIMVKSEVRTSRVVQGRDYSMFYNPMWGKFGDWTAGAAGTHYYSASKPVTQFWHMFDQVLLRRSLMNNLVDLDILTEVTDHSFTTAAGKPGGESGSDHFPLIVTLEV